MTTRNCFNAMNKSLLRAGLVLSALSVLPVASANCFIDRFGRERCTLSTGARIGIAVASIVAFIAVFACLGLSRRRRIRNANLAYVTSQQQQQQQQQQPGYAGYGQPYGTQYPYGSTPAYDATGGAYAPQGYGGSYVPPPGPPPAASQYPPPPQYSGTPGTGPYSPPKGPPPAHV